MVVPKIRLEGFARKGSRFWRDGPSGTRYLVELQSSRSGSAIAINYGVRSATLARLLETDLDAGLLIDDCHHRDRVTMEDGQEWWIPKGELHSVDRGIREQVLPCFASIPDEDALRDLWLEGRSRGLTEVQRLLYLAVLLRELGPAEALPRVVTTLRAHVEGTLQEGRITRTLARVGILQP